MEASRLAMRYVGFTRIGTVRDVIEHDAPNKATRHFSGAKLNEQRLEFWALPAANDANDKPGHVRVKHYGDITFKVVLVLVPFCFIIIVPFCFITRLYSDGVEESRVAGTCNITHDTVHVHETSPVVYLIVSD